MTAFSKIVEQEEKVGVTLAKKKKSLFSFLFLCQWAYLSVCVQEGAYSPMRSKSKQTNKQKRKHRCACAVILKLRKRETQQCKSVNTKKIRYQELVLFFSLSLFFFFSAGAEKIKEKKKKRARNTKGSKIYVRTCASEHKSTSLSADQLHSSLYI